MFRHIPTSIVIRSQSSYIFNASFKKFVFEIFTHFNIKHQYYEKTKHPTKMLETQIIVGHKIS